MVSRLAGVAATLAIVGAIALGGAVPALASTHTVTWARFTNYTGHPAGGTTGTPLTSLAGYVATEPIMADFIYDGSSFFWTGMHLQMTCPDGTTIVNGTSSTYASGGAFPSDSSLSGSCPTGGTLTFRMLDTTGSGTLAGGGTGSWVDTIGLSTPVPVITPAPVPTAPPVGGLGYTTNCLHGYNVSFSGGFECQWWSWGGATGYAGGGSGDVTQPGPLFASELTTSGPGRSLTGLSTHWYVLPEPGAAWASLNAPLTLAPGTTSVVLSMGWAFGAAGGSANGFMYLDAEFYKGGTFLVRQIDNPTVTGGSPGTFATATLTVPAGATAVRWFAGCLQGAACAGPGGTDPYRLGYVALREYQGATGSTVTPIQGCDALTLPGNTPPCAGVTIDPNNSRPVCGLFSGDCTKKFIAPLPIPICNPGGGPFDVVGWLAYIQCTIVQVSLQMGNVGIGIANDLIDLIFPGQGLALSLKQFYDDLTGKVPFSYVSSISSGVSSFLASPAGPDPSLSVTFPSIRGVGGGTFTIPSFPIDSGVRAAMGGLIYIAGAWLVLKQVRGALGAGSDGTA